MGSIYIEQAAGVIDTLQEEITRLKEKNAILQERQAMQEWSDSHGDTFL
jgi:FtsZ-binding cell division protein ZapB